MLKTHWRYTSILIIAFCVSCTDSKKAEPDLLAVNLVGDYYELDKDNIKLYLPPFFDYFSEENYENIIKALPDSYEKEVELKRFNYLKFSKGNVYYLKDFASSTLITVKMMKHFKFSRKDSAQLLGIISLSCAELSEKLNSECKKISAGYSGNYKTQVFKALYEQKDSNGKIIYNTIYLITSNLKTFSINIYSNKIEKIIVE